MCIIGAKSIGGLGKKHILHTNLKSWVERADKFLIKTGSGVHVGVYLSSSMDNDWPTCNPRNMLPQISPVTHNPPSHTH